MHIFSLIISFLALGAIFSTPSYAEQVESEPGAEEAKRPYFNDKKIPDANDLKAIQKLLQKNLKNARAATVCIQLSQGSGSGVIVSEDGLVLSAAHVTTGVNKELTVIMEDGKKLKARSLGLNAEFDAAMLQITEKGKYPFVKIEPEKERDKASTLLGDWVFSIGHSGGFDEKRGSGVRLGRLVRIAETTIQSDCTLIGGDSGGPLFDINGLLIGIHSRVGAVTEQNMHVPIHVFHTDWEAMKNADFIGEGPFAQKPVKGAAFIGIALKEVANGLEITDVEEDSVAAKAGVKIGDVLTSADGKAITKKEQLATLMKDKAEGDDLTLTLLTGETKREVKFQLEAR